MYNCNMEIKTSHALALLLTILLGSITLVNWANKQIDLALYVPLTQTASVADFNLDLVAHYTFDDNTNDSAGSNNGTASGGPTYVEGKIGKAMQFDGVDDYVEVSGSGLSFLEGAGQVTVAFWIKKNAQGGSYVARWGIGRQFDIRSDINFPLRPFWRYGGTGTGGSSIDHYCGNSVCPIPIGEWHHIAVVYNNPTSFIYIDG